MVFITDTDCTEHFVPLRRLSPGLVFSSLPLRNLEFGEERVPIEVATFVTTGSIVITVGAGNKHHYVVRTIDIVHAAYHADRLYRRREARG